MLYFVFTIDGDWVEYYDPALSEEKRKPSPQVMSSLVQREIKICSQFLGGKFIHFVHSSPRARDFFLKPPFDGFWKDVVKGGGSIGLHIHEDDPHKSYSFDDEAKMKSAIEFLSSGLRKSGINLSAYRGGYLAFSPKIIPLLEKNGIFLDFSCEPGRYLKHGELLVSDWRGAPDNFYRLSYDDHRQKGESKVFEVPLGIYVELDSLFKIWRKARSLRKKAESKDIVVSVLAHAFEFGSPYASWKIKRALSILKRYGQFVNAEEALSIIQKK